MLCQEITDYVPVFRRCIIIQIHKFIDEQLYICIQRFAQKRAVHIRMCFDSYLVLEISEHVLEHCKAVDQVLDIAVLLSDRFGSALADTPHVTDLSYDRNSARFVMHP